MFSNLIDFFVIEDMCPYKSFGINQLVTDEGAHIEDKAGSVDDCTLFCDARSECKSFTYCSGSGLCHFKEKAINGTEKTTSHSQCTTYYPNPECSK